MSLQSAPPFTTERQALAGILSNLPARFSSKSSKDNRVEFQAQLCYSFHGIRSNPFFNPQGGAYVQKNPAVGRRFCRGL